VRRVKSRDVV